MEQLLAPGEGRKQNEAGHGHLFIPLTWSRGDKA